MAEVTSAMVKALREKTGAGMVDCKNALAEANGDEGLAIEVLRKKGLKDVGKRSGRTAAEGTLGVYVHPGSQVVAIVELNCETDFVARGEDFQKVAHDIAMQVAAMRPQYLTAEEVPAEVLKKEEEIILEQLSPEQRAKAADKIIPGKIQAFLKDAVLLSQPFVRDDSGKKSVQDIIQELSVKVGEKVSLRRFQCFQVGEGLEKKVADLAGDVAAAISGA